MTKTSTPRISTLPVVQSDDACCVVLPTVVIPQETTRVLKALADETRLSLLVQIASSSEAVCVCDLTSQASVNQPTVSHHLKLLRDAGIVNVERRGTWGHYSLRPDRSPLVDAVLGSLR